MKPFLQTVAEKFYQEYGVGLSDLCFVFPNRRSSLFFQKYLGIAAGKPIFSPKLITINNLFIELSGYRIADKIEALYILYQKYVKLMNWVDGKCETFDQFVWWGDVILADFDDIDKYLVNADKLFANVKDLKDLDSGYDFLSESQIAAIQHFWRSFLAEQSTSGNGGSDAKKQFISLWEILHTLYTDFRCALKSNGLAYEGMVYREIAEKIIGDEGDAIITNLKSKYKQIVFIGQNAFNKCEKCLCDRLMKEDLADFYWDYSGRMITDKDNKSSLFMSQNVSKYKSKYNLDTSFGESTEYDVISVPSAVGQTSAVASILSELSACPHFTPETTAIVLPDENLLVPMLNAIPATIENVNVTMGMPLAGSNSDSFMNSIIKLQKNVKEINGQNCFYYRNVIEVLQHPFFINGVGKDLAKIVKDEIVLYNIIFPSSEYLQKKGPVFELIFKHPANTSDIPEYQISVIDEIQKSLVGIDREFIYQYRKVITRLSDLKDLSGNKLKISADTYYKLLKQAVAIISIPFKGEPLKGLQIMGPLETRALDFDNVIILSCNEGIFPKKTVSSSLIPYNLRRGFELPTYEYQDSISAYHFYRSIYRAKRVIMLYDSRTSGLKNGEVSRYVQQLKYHYKINVTNKLATYSNISQLDNGKFIKVVKDDIVMKELNERFIVNKKPFSPSSLNNYLNCPLKYYFENVKGIKDDADVTEDIENDKFGTIYHKVMENMYKPFINKIVTAVDIDSMLGCDIAKMVEDAFEKEAKIRTISGKNLIIKELIIKYIKKTLERDKETVPFNYHACEQQLSFPMQLTDGRQVTFFGTIDRIDSFTPGSVRIVDYKTGTIENKVNNDKIEEMFNHNWTRPSISFQLYLYSLLYKKNCNLTTILNACVYSTRDLFKNYPDSYEFSDAQLKEFESRLQSLIEEIFNPDIDFFANPDYDHCKYCKFKPICENGN